jgi:alpha-L-fucosidase
VFGVQNRPSKYDLVMRRIALVIFSAITFVIPLSGEDQVPAPILSSETAAQQEARMAWWREAKFGMFIHWDMSSLAGTEISWSRKGSKPLDIHNEPAGYVEDPVYDHLYEKFNPVDFDAAKWVKLAQDSGAKYIVFTAKHHGGFCMWDTKFTDYNIMHTPFHRDVVKELADACHAAGMRFGIYYSPRDWHNPDYGIGDNQKYVDYMNGQLRELLTNYGKVDLLWFDSYGRGDLVNFWKIGSTWSLIKSLQPDIIVNNRLTVLANYDRQPQPYRGDFDTPEQRIGGFQSGRPWESCMSIVHTRDGGGWSYRPDGVVRTLDECIRGLVSCAVGDGNLLLDAGPNSLGDIPTDQAQRFLQIGDWLKTCGESVYGTRGGPYVAGRWGGATYKGSTIYLHFFHSTTEDFKLIPLHQKVISFHVLAGNADVNVVQSADRGLEVTIPADNTSVDTIIQLDLDQPVDRILAGHALVVDPKAAPGK